MSHLKGRGNRWLALGMSAGMIAGHASLPAHSLAQAPDAASAEQASPTEEQPQILQETRTTVPLTPPAPAGNGTTPQQGNAPGSAPTVAALPENKHPSEKQERKAEKLYLQGAKFVEQDNPRGAYQAFTAAAALDTANHQYLAAREIARQHLLTRLVQEAEKARLKSVDSSSAPDPRARRLHGIRVARNGSQVIVVIDPSSPLRPSK